MKIIFENLNVMTKEVNLKVSVSSEEINKSVMLTKEIVKDYNISITTLDNNTFNLRNNGNEYKRLFTIINYGLTKEADARLVFQYNALDYRQVNMKEIFTCNFTASIITCDFKKLDKKEFFIEEIYDYDLGKNICIYKVWAKSNRNEHCIRSVLVNLCFAILFAWQNYRLRLNTCKKKLKYCRQF